MSQVDLGDALIAHDDRGAGPAVIFAHGLGGNRLSWWQQVPPLSRRFRCVTFSHRGFFGSTSRSGRVDTAAMAHDIEALADALGLSRFALAAQSMSGWPAVELALTRPDRLTALVMCSTSGSVDPGLADPDAVAAWSAWSQQRVASHVDPGYKVSDIALHERRPDLDFLYAQIQALTTEADVPSIRAMLRATRVRPPSVLSDLRIPTLWLGGSLDLYYPASALPALAAHVPGSVVHLFPACGHSPYFQEAEAFNDVVGAFLARHAG